MQLTDYLQPTPLVKQVLSDRKPGKVLDIGSHEGRNALYLARLGWEVLAIDTDAAALAILQEAAQAEDLQISTVASDVRTYELEIAFDAVLSLMVFHFLPKEDITPTIQKVQEWTRPGGINLVTVFTDDNPAGTRPYLFPANALHHYYNNWNIKDYEETYSSWIIPEGKTEPERYSVARIAAEKA